MVLRNSAQKSVRGCSASCSEVLCATVPLDSACEDVGIWRLIIATQGEPERRFWMTNTMQTVTVSVTTESHAQPQDAESERTERET
jgi:hypothetical protein